MPELGHVVVGVAAVPGGPDDPRLAVQPGGLQRVLESTTALPAVDAADGPPDTKLTRR